MFDPIAELLNDKGQVRHDRVDDLLVEVVSGKYIWTQNDPPFAMYASRCPAAAEQDNARIVYVRALKTAQARGLLLKADLEQVALEGGLFKPSERDEKISLVGMIERQVRAKEKSQSETQKAQLTLEMEVGRKRLMEIEMDEWKILQHCAEARAEEVRQGYYVAHCTMTGEMLDKPVWGSWEEFQDSGNWSIFHDARSSYARVSHGLPIKVIRALARATEWRVRWKSCKESRTQPFEGAHSNWDRNKVNLIYWSDFYDSIYQHPECPDEQTISNDEYLQLWINAQIAKRGQNKASGPTGRKGPTYLDGSGKRKPMTKVGTDQTIRVGTPYKVRV